MITSSEKLPFLLCCFICFFFFASCCFLRTYPQLLQLIFPNCKDILIRNYGVFITPKEINDISIMSFNIQCSSNFPNCPPN